MLRCVVMITWYGSFYTGMTHQTQKEIRPPDSPGRKNRPSVRNARVPKPARGNAQETRWEAKKSGNVDEAYRKTAPVALPTSKMLSWQKRLRCCWSATFPLRLQTGVRRLIVDTGSNVSIMKLGKTRH